MINPHKIYFESVPGPVYTAVEPVLKDPNAFYAWVGGIFDQKKSAPRAGSFFTPGLRDHKALKKLIQDSMAKNNLTEAEAIERLEDWGKGAGNSSVTHMPSAFAEIDDCPLDEQLAAYDKLEKEAGITFHLRVFSGNESAHGHTLFRLCLTKENDKEMWTEIQKHLIVLLRADPKITELGRKMREPGYFGPDRDQKVLVCRNDNRLAADQVLSRLQAVAKKRGIDVDKGFEALKLAEQLKSSDEPVAKQWRDYFRAKLEILPGQRETIAPLLEKKVGKRTSTPTGKTSKDVVSMPHDTQFLGTDGKYYSFNEVKKLAAGTRFCCPSCNPSGDDSNIAGVVLDKGHLFCHRCSASLVSKKRSILQSTLSRQIYKSAKRYLDPFTLSHDVTLVKADTGSGKTTRLKELIASLPKDSKVIGINHRRLLTMFLAAELAMDNYQELDGTITLGMVIFVINSLARLDKDSRTADLVFIEESESVFTELFGETLGRVKSARRATSGGIHAVLSQLISNTLNNKGKIVCLDGHMSWLTEEALKLCGVKSHHTVQHIEHVVPLTNYKLQRFRYREGLIANILQEYREGKRIVITAPRQKEVEALTAYFRSELDEDKVISIHSTANPKDRESVRDPNTEWAKAQILIYSPSVDAGVSYDPSDKNSNFDIHYVLADRVPGIGVTRLLQMWHRIRHTPDLRVWIDKGYKNSKATEIKKVAEELDTRFFASSAVAQVNGVCFSARPHEEDHFKLAILVEAHKRLSWANVEEDFFSYFKSRGATIVDIAELPPKHRKELRDWLKGLKEQVKISFINAVLNAKKPPLVEFEALQTKSEKTKDERQAFEKGRCFDTYGLINEEIISADINRKLKKATTNLVWLRLISEGKLKKAYELDSKTVETGYRAHSQGISQRNLFIYSLIETYLGDGFFNKLFKGEDLYALRWTKDSLKELEPEVDKLVKQFPRAQDLLEGTGVKLYRIPENPTEVLGYALKFFGVETKKARKQVNKKRVYTYSLAEDQEAVRLCQRSYDKAVGNKIIPYEDLEKPDAEATQPIKKDSKVEAFKRTRKENKDANPKTERQHSPLPLIQCGQTKQKEKEVNEAKDNVFVGGSGTNEEYLNCARKVVCAERDISDNLLRL